MTSTYPISESIGRKIRYYRKKNNMTMTELSQLIGISEQQQSRCERGINRIDIDRLNQYSEIFNVHISLFFVFLEKSESGH
nr:helix-turn-helix transcriptional regulator [uncultured Moellerella sp.]